MGRTGSSLHHEFPPQSGGRIPHREELVVGRIPPAKWVEMIVVVVAVVVIAVVVVVVCVCVCLCPSPSLSLFLSLAGWLVDCLSVCPSIRLSSLKNSFKWF